jgi:transcriptional regulator with XRE-family HTH domain
MTPKQFRSALDRLGLSQLGAARLFGADGRTARRWALGERAVPETVAILLRLLMTDRITADDIEAAKRGQGVETKKRSA